MPSAAHIIRKQVYDLNVLNQAEGRAMQKKLHSLNMLHLLPAMNSVFDELFGDDEVVVIDKLDIDIGFMGKHQSSDYWVQEISQKLRQQLKNITSGSGPANTTHALLRKTKWQQAADNLLFFLNHGNLPEDSIYQSISALFEDLIEGLEPIQKEVMVRRWNWPQPAVLWKRLVANAAPDILAPITTIFIPGLKLQDAQLLTPAFKGIAVSKKDSVAKAFARFYIEQRFANQVPSVSVRQFAQVLELISHAEPGKTNYPRPKASEGVSPMVPENIDLANDLKTGKDLDRHEASDGRLDEDKSMRYWQVANAGLCLLSPYVQAIFGQCGLCVGNQFVSRQHQEHAIFLLHFMATGEEETTEDQLVLPKLLAGWPLQMPCLNPWAISDSEKTEAEDLLRSVIGYWSALKNTSPDGLRDGFLTRPGRLTLEEDHYLLQVEPKTVDILLDQVPWGFRNILLPWVDKRVVVEWY